MTHEHFHHDYPRFVINRKLYAFLSDRHPRTHYFSFFLKEDEKNPR